MKLLSRYLLKELVIPLVVWVAFLFLLLFVMQFLRGTDVLLGSAVTLGDMGWLLVYLAPHFLVMALPIAFLLAILLGLGRLSEDREITALQALGIGPVRLIAGPLFIGAVLSGLMLLITCTAEPWGLTSVKEFVAEIIKKNVVGDVKPGVFYEDLSNLTLYAEQVEEGGAHEWTHVLVHDDREPSAPLLMLARQGQVNTNTAGQVLTLVLGDGEAHRANRGEASYSVITFEKAELAVGVEGRLGRRNRFRSPKEELTPVELLEAAEEAERTGGDPRPFRMALHTRLGNALAPLSFALLGTPLAIGRRQGGRAWGFLLTLAGYVLFYLLTRVFEQMGQQGRLPMPLAGQLTNLVFCVVGAVALYRVNRSGDGAVSATLFRYVARTYVGFAVGILCALVTVFLVVDFVDRSRMYTGEGWVWSVVVLYANKALLSVQQLGPAALLLAAGAAVSSLRKRGEVTAMRALSFGPKALYLPVGVCVALACVGLIAFDEWVVVQAGMRVDEITTQRFGRWGDWSTYHTPKQWFRRGDHIFYLRSGSAREGFVDVAILTVTPDFRLERRVDARSMRPVEGTRWKLEGVVERTFTREGQSSVRELDEVEYDLGADARTFRIRPGRPEQMRVPVLREQIAARGEVGLATRQFSLVLHNRFAYPLAGLPAALLAVGLALRPGRKGNLTVALVEGLLISMIMWGLMVVARTLVLSERLSPVLAAWFPVALLVVAAALLWLRGEGRLGKGAG